MYRVQNRLVRSIHCPAGLLLLLLICLPPVSFAATSRWHDISDYFSQPLHWSGDDWRTAGLLAAGVAGSMVLDHRVRHVFADGGGSAKVARFGNGFGSRDGILVEIGWFLTGWLLDDPQMARTGANMMEADAFSAATTSVVKVATGRLRPNATSGNGHWLDGGKSFPSGHVTSAFARATAFAESSAHPAWWRRGLAYGLAATTVYARLHDNKHWLSDTAAGALVGAGSALFVVHRHGPDSIRLSLTDTAGGLGLQLGIPLP